jgi:hypothetical protein
MDEDLAGMSREQLMDEVRRLRQGIRTHRDSAGHDLCWHHPELWKLLPEKQDPLPTVPDWPEFLRGCLAYRESLDRELPDAPRSAELYRHGRHVRPAVWRRELRRHSPQAAVHNVPEAAGRRRAVEEMARVLRPGGTILLADIRNLGDYADALRGQGLEARVEGSAIGRALLGIITFGALRPGLVRARRPAGR